MDYSRFMNRVSLAREPSTLRALLKNLEENPVQGAILLANGIPNQETFPFRTASFGLNDGTTIEITGKRIYQAFQYMSTDGYPPLVSYLKELQLMLHNPPQWSNSTLLVNSGSQEGYCKAFEMILSENDSVIVQEPNYCGTLYMLHPYKVRYIVAETDSLGMIPDCLRKSLESLKKSQDTTKNFPKVIYVNPTGTNPTGTSLPLERRKEVYKIAQDFDLLIIEDDPYYFLQYENERIPSFLSMDVDGRVLRFDSFSKIVSAGLRLGYITGPAPLVKRIELHIEVSSFHPTSLSQILVTELFDKWGIEGFVKHAENVREFYKGRRDWMVQCADKYLKGLVEYHIPNGGMFLWIKCLNVCDVKAMLEVTAFHRKIIIVPGNYFMTDPSKPCSYMRISFSLASIEEIDRGFRDLADIIREEELVQH